MTTGSNLQLRSGHRLGAAGSLVVLVAWVYYSAQIFLFGAEYTWVYANRHGSRVQKTAPGVALAVPSRSGDYP